jgi:1,2-diacylglycerol 3-beta-galactosyltransferase
MPAIDCIFFDAGGGHRAAATALQTVLERERPGWEFRLVHLRDILDSIDVFRKVLRIDLQEAYNLILRRGWTLGSPQGLRFMQQVIRLNHRPAVRLLRQFWSNRPADMVVSVVPNFNRAIYDGLQAARPGCRYVTILTDLADYPPRFWIERQSQDFICGTPKAVEQALAYGHPRERVFPTSGMILNPRFYEVRPADRAGERRRLGLDPALPTGIVLFGGYGTSVMRSILRDLDRSGLPLQLILIAGHNEKLRRALEATPTAMPRHIEGFTREIPYFMQLADFFIGKPGPGSLSEAIHMGLPALTVSNAWTLLQERYNARWLEENEYGIAMRGYGEITGATARLLESLDRYQQNLAAHPNRAVFEIPAILDTILNRPPCSPSSP